MFIFYTSSLSSIHRCVPTCKPKGKKQKTKNKNSKFVVNKYNFFSVQELLSKRHSWSSFYSLVSTWHGFLKINSGYEKQSLIFNAFLVDLTFDGKWILWISEKTKIKIINFSTVIRLQNMAWKNVQNADRERWFPTWVLSLRSWWSLNCICFK